MKQTITIIALVLMAFSAMAQQPKPQPLTQEEFEALCPTPPMGWNSWNKFGCNVSEQLLMEAADAMVSSGMKDAGYEYIVVDDCWQVDRDADGNITIPRRASAPIATCTASMANRAPTSVPPPTIGNRCLLRSTATTTPWPRCFTTAA